MAEARLKVAIIGGGIAGATLAVGLIRRGVDAVIYERGRSFREIGAGIGFTPNAERAMKELHPEIHTAFKDVAVQNASDWFKWMDGAGCSASYSGPADPDIPIHEMYLGERGFEGCSRSDFLDRVVKLLPDGTIHLSKNLYKIKPGPGGDGLELDFVDGSSTRTDVVIGCDGIRSRVRQLMFGIENPTSHPSYTYKYAFRGLIPMEKARPVLGNKKIETRHMYLGPNGHALTFPVADGKLLNVVAFAADDKDWPDAERFTAPAKKEEAVNAFKEFNPTVQSVIDLLPEQLDKWAIFDTHVSPAPTFALDQVCLSGDAAHAAAPYHGAGAGFAIEDGAVLASLLADVDKRIGRSNLSKSNLICKALQAYSNTRTDRAQWLVESSHFLGEMYQWRDNDIKGDRLQCAQEIEWRSRKIWDYDIAAMVQQASSTFDKSLVSRSDQ